jgi:5-amino-6-(5-phosphoribosylamino)uracil reductase
MKMIASVAISLDGCLDDCSPRRLILSSPEDLQSVHELRAQCDAILVGAQTLRSDNPSLCTRHPEWIEWRRRQCLPRDPIKVTLTASGHLPVNGAFFAEGKDQKRVYCPLLIAPHLTAKLENKATVIGLASVTAKNICADLAKSGVKTILIEGGAKVLKMFFDEDQVDELRLALAPLFVGDARAPRFLGATCSQTLARWTLTNTRQFGDTVVLDLTPRKK